MRSFLVLLVTTLFVITGCGSTAPSDAPVLPNLRVKPEVGVVYVGIIGDSYTSGLPSDAQNADLWPVLMTRTLQSQGLKIKTVVAARNGSGYVSHGVPGSVPFINQTDQVAGTNDKLMIFFGAANDKTILPGKADKYALSVQQTLAKARKAAPNASFLVIGPAWSLPEPPGEVLQVRDIIQTEAAAMGASFIDPLAERWFADNPAMIAVNGDRPSQVGQAFIAQRISPVVAQLLQQPSKP